MFNRVKKIRAKDHLTWTAVLTVVVRALPWLVLLVQRGSVQIPVLNYLAFHFPKEVVCLVVWPDGGGGGGSITLAVK